MLLSAEGHVRQQKLLELKMALVFFHESTGHRRSVVEVDGERVRFAHSHSKLAGSRLPSLACTLCLRVHRLDCVSQ